MHAQMAAVSSLAQQRRRKQATYGKASRNASAWNVKSFDASDDDEKSSPPKVIIPQVSKTVRESYTIQKHESKPHGLKSIKARAKKQDDFDVPSSDDEVGNTITHRSPPSVATKRKLVDDNQEQELAPWERRATEASQDKSTFSNSQVETAASAEQLRTELAQVTPKKVSGLKGKRASPSPAKDVASPGGSSAAARLKARKLLAGQCTQSSVEEAQEKPLSRIQKRIKHEGAESEPISRKRPRSGELAATGNNEDILMNDVRAPSCESASPVPEEPPAPSPAKQQKDIFEFPDSSADDTTGGGSKLPKRKSPQNRIRRGKLNMTSRSSPHKMVSAPARLHEMLPPSDTSTTTSAARSPSMSTSRPSTPNKPTASKFPTPDTTTTKKSLTPKGLDVWDPMMEDEVSAPSPSGLPMQDLTIRSTKRTTAKPTAVPRTLTKSSSDLGPARRRTKLVDRLKASAPSSDNDSSEDEESTDVNMSSDEISPPRGSANQSQMYSQNSAVVENGPKITYAARVRSYLPEDSFEDGLMLDLNTEINRPPATFNRRTTTKSNTASQNMTFDLEESDDENAGRMRTIHELRAGGGNRRFEDETSGLLDDIADHTASGRSRRRSALIELAKNLKDKAFVERFFRHGFERRLLRECVSALDDVADVLLAAILAMLLSRDTPDHLAQSLRDGGALQWLVKLALNRTELRKLSKDRRSNMSKTAQATFMDFTDDLAKQEDIWGHMKPVALTVRTLVLKVLEAVIVKLRKTGDRTDLVEGDDVRSIAPAEEDISHSANPATLTDVMLSVSVLESLYANAATLAWPTDITDRLIGVFLRPTGGQEKLQHLHILALRLCTYLTTDNVRNCKAFSKSDTISYLLRAMLDSFGRHSADLTQEQREQNLAFLVPAIGVAINLTLHNEKSRNYAATGEAALLLSDLVIEFQVGQKRMLEAESVEDGVANVAYGSLAVVLANLCRNRGAKQIIASKLPGNNLDPLVSAVEEFLVHHQKVDMMADEAGVEVWGAFTEKLKEILKMLKLEA